VSAVPYSPSNTLGSRIFHKIFSFPGALSCLLIALAVLTVRARFNDPDMWWHLRVGQLIWDTHVIPVTDVFSFTTNHHAWVPHEWLSQLSIFAAYHWLGMSGLMLWLCAFSSAIFIAGYALCSLYSGNAKVSLVGALAVFVFATVGLAVRPQVIGYFLLLIELILIQLGRTRSTRWFWALPPLFAVWVNCHGSFFLGIVIAGIFIFTSFFDFQYESFVSRSWIPGTRKAFLIAMGLSLAALFLNPVGIKQVLYPLDTLLNQPVGLSTVQEWLPMQLSSQRGILFMALIASCFFLVILRKTELYFDELLLMAAAVWLAGSHDRMTFVFGILAAPILSRMLSNSWDTYDPTTDLPLPNAVLIIPALLVAYFAFPDSANLQAQIQAKSPVKAVQFIKANHLNGPMLNDYTDGGYLIWALPEVPVFIDGRGDVFEWAGVLPEFGQWATIQTDPNKLLNKYKIQFCLLTPDSPEAQVLPLIHWKAIYSDSQSVIFVRDSFAVPAP
jgi:hypothetical protein